MISIVRCDRMSGVVAENIRPDFVRGLARSVFPHGAGQVVLIRLEQGAGTAVATCGQGQALVAEVSGRAPICPAVRCRRCPVWQGSNALPAQRILSAQARDQRGDEWGHHTACLIPDDPPVTAGRDFPVFPALGPCVG